MRRKVFWVVGLLVLFSASFASAQFKFERPITIIVPWAAGGASDQTARVLAGEMEKTLGQKIAMVNQPGGSGSIGQKAVYDAKHDGYTWAGNADGSVVTYQKPWAFSITRPIGIGTTTMPSSHPS
jgi:tripartite-type tricarboxylate transporter receptor subunit TctC